MREGASYPITCPARSQSPPTLLPIVLFCESQCGSLPSDSGAMPSTTEPAAARVRRSKGKAALRSLSLEADPQLLHQHHQLAAQASLVSAEMSDAELQAQLSAASAAVQHAAEIAECIGSAGSNSKLDSSTAPLPCCYKRSTTDPVSLWVATGSMSMRLPSVPAAGVSTSLRVSAPGAGLMLASMSYADAADEEDALASPAGHAPLVPEPEHCDWEDGVVAGWLGDMDDAAEHDIHHHHRQQQGYQYPHQGGPSSASGNTPGAGCKAETAPLVRTQGSTASSYSVAYSSALYC
jgi:hypothetical protein